MFVLIQQCYVSSIFYSYCDHRAMTVTVSTVCEYDCIAIV